MRHLTEQFFCFKTATSKLLIKREQSFVPPRRNLIDHVQCTFCYGFLSSRGLSSSFTSACLYKRCTNVADKPRLYFCIIWERIAQDRKPLWRNELPRKLPYKPLCRFLYTKVITLALWLQVILNLGDDRSCEPSRRYQSRDKKNFRRTFPCSRV